VTAGPGAITGRGPALSAASAVLLDMDGTLVRSEHVHRQTWWRFLDSWGVTVSEDEYERHYVGRRARDVLEEIPGPWTGTDTSAALLAMDELADELRDAVTVVPGAPELVRALRRRGRPVAVVTSAARDWARHVLDAVLGVADQVSVLVTAEDVALGKPAPEGYLLACSRLGLEPAGCAGVEDSPSGVRALVGAAVGTVVGITTTSSAAELHAAGARWTVPDLLAQRWSLTRDP
jgi:sugar-phosphatase